MATGNLQHQWRLFTLQHGENYNIDELKTAFRNREIFCELVSRIWNGDEPEYAESIFSQAVTAWKEDSGYELEDAQNHVWNATVGEMSLSLSIDKTIANFLCEAVNMTTFYKVYLQPDYQHQIVQRALDSILDRCRMSARQRN